MPSNSFSDGHNMFITAKMEPAIPCLLKSDALFGHKMFYNSNSN